MSVIRRRHNRNFTVVTNEVINDARLSCEALGMITYLLSRPNNWKIITTQLGERFKMGKDKTHRVLRELRDNNYLAREFVRNESGHITGSELIVYDEPQTDEDADNTPKAGKAGFRENQRPENPAAVIRTNTNQTPISPTPSSADPPPRASAALRDGALPENRDTRQDQSVSPPPAPVEPAEATTNDATSVDAEGLAGRENRQDRFEREFSFEEFWSDYKQRNPRYREDAERRWATLTIEEQSQAHTRLSQYFGMCIARAAERGRRPFFETGAAYLGDRIFKKFAPALHAQRPKPVEPRTPKLTETQALCSDEGIRALELDCVSVFCDFVAKRGVMPQPEQWVGLIAEARKADGLYDPSNSVTGQWAQGFIDKRARREAFIREWAMANDRRVVEPERRKTEWDQASVGADAREEIS